MTKRTTTAVLAAALLASIGAGPATRPREPWVFRSVLDGRARMLTCALSDKLYVSYDTQAGSIYRAWTGGVKFTGGVYDARHGPQPQSQGAAYFRQKGVAEWFLIGGGREQLVRPRYLGYTTDGESVSIAFAVDAPGGRVIVRETPSCEIADNAVTLVRTFTVDGLPEKYVVQLGGSAEADDPTPRFKQEMPDITNFVDIDRQTFLRFDRNGTYRLKTVWSAR